MNRGWPKVNESSTPLRCCRDCLRIHLAEYLHDLLVVLFPVLNDALLVAGVERAVQPSLGVKVLVRDILVEPSSNHGRKELIVNSCAEVFGCLLKKRLVLRYDRVPELRIENPCGIC